MRGTGALARASMAELKKPDRVRAAELAQTGAGRGRARGEKIEREHESTRVAVSRSGAVSSGGAVVAKILLQQEQEEGGEPTGRRGGAGAFEGGGGVPFRLLAQA